MPRLTVVICSLNGADGVQRCLRALRRQTIADAIEVVVVDDGSTDGTSAVATAAGAVLVRHRHNRGLSAARNSGIARARAEIVAFLDDDCEPEPEWAEELLRVYGDHPRAAGVGGPIVAAGTTDDFLSGYLGRHNPLGVLELDLARSAALPYRLKLYVKRMWSRPVPDAPRAVYSLVGANMSFRREVLLALGGFDERFTFGADELDLCHRIGIQLPWASLRFEPSAVVRHHFEPSLRDTLRRSRSYGVGSGRFSRRWRDRRPTLYPLPAIFLLLLAASWRRPYLLSAAAVTPHLFAPRGLVSAVADRTPTPMVDAYVQLLQETFHDIGCVIGLRRFRTLSGADAAHLPVLSPHDVLAPLAVAGS